MGLEFDQLSPLVPRLRVCGAVFPFPQYACMVHTSVQGQLYVCADLRNVTHIIMSYYNHWN
jgi:hypothetical protein